MSFLYHLLRLLTVFTFIGWLAGNTQQELWSSGVTFVAGYLAYWLFVPRYHPPKQEK